MKSWAKNIPLALIIAVLLLCFLPLNALASQPIAGNDQTVKVFFPLQDGFAAVDNNGDYNGYNYEYLMKIAQLTGWQYELVPTELTNSSLLEGLEKVKQGELQLAGIMDYSETLAEEYEYSMPYGDADYVLLTEASNEKLNSRTLSDYLNLRVAIVEAQNEQNILFEEFCRQNGIKFQPVYGASSDECLKMMNIGLADAVISKDIDKNIGLKVVAKFSSSPFYFVAKKGNVELIKQLNSALRAIEVSDPNYKKNLHAKYFATNSSFDLPLTEDEQEYLASAPTVRVAVLSECAPIQSYNKETGEFSGILVDLLEVVSQRSGIKFELFASDDENLLRESLNDGTCDIVLGVPYVYRDSIVTKESSGILLTPPVFSSPIIRISSLKKDIKNSEIIVSRSIKAFKGKSNIIYSDNIKEIFELINEGEYSEAYINGYMAQHAAEYNDYPDVSLSFTSYGNYELCFGVSRKSDLRLINILTQAIATLSDAEIEEVVYVNTNHEVDNSIWTIVKRNPAQAAIPVLTVLVIILGLLSLLFLKTRRLNRIISKEKNEYKAISQLDRLSKTYNNGAFKQLAMSYLIQQDAKAAGALVICDIDDFKGINDTLGHLKGDEVIATLGELMTSIFRGDDIVGRLGGDEFVVLLKNISSTDVVRKRCIELCEKSRTIIPEREVTLSIGVATFSGVADFDELFKLADAVLYDVKNNGKNAYKICVENVDKALNIGEALSNDNNLSNSYIP